MKSLLVAIASVVLVGSVWAKLPAPSDEAKAKSAEAAAKTAHNGKVDAYLLCKSQDKVAARQNKGNKAKAKDDKAPALPACTDPGAFVYTPAAPATAASPAAAPVVAAAPADKPKKP
jgi:hypothetical protein